MAEQELEQQRKQHHVAMDKLLLQTQSLEQALKTERHVVTEERCVPHCALSRPSWNNATAVTLHRGNCYFLL